MKKKNPVFYGMQNKGIRVPSTHGRFPLRPSYSVIRQDKPMVLTATKMKWGLQTQERNNSCR